jgi:uncharacterized membrane protein YdjX (TVP38/TMEM64 family)
MTETRGLPTARVGTSARVLAGVLAVGVIVVLMAVGALPGAQEIRSSVHDSGPTGALVFLAAYAVLAALPTPAGALTIVAGTVFGFVQGLVLVVLAATGGSLLGFALARYGICQAG